MISFNLTALTQPTLSIQRKSKTRIIFPRKTFQNFTQLSFIVPIFNKTVVFLQNLVSSITALKHFKEKAFADMTTTFSMDEDEQPMATEPIYLSSDESEINSPPSSPVPQPPDNVPDIYSAITQLIAAQREQMSLPGISAPQCPITPPTSLISDDNDIEMLTPIGGNRAQFLTYTRDSRSIPETPESPTPENRGHTDDILQPSLIPLNNPPNIITLADGLRDMTLHPHRQCNERETGCSVCCKSYGQVIDETVADYLQHTAQLGETVRDRQIKRKAFIDGLQSSAFIFLPPGVSQAAACDGLVYSVDYNGQNSGTQASALPLFED